MVKAGQIHLAIAAFHCSMQTAMLGNEPAGNHAAQIGGTLIALLQRTVENFPTRRERANKFDRFNVEMLFADHIDDGLQPVDIVTGIQAAIGFGAMR